MTAHYEDGPVQIWHGDCIDVMRGMPDNSVDAVVTDPPYGLNFMGKDWDSPAGQMVGQISEGLERATNGPLARGGTHSRGYADNDNRAFQAWCELWAIEAFRLLKPGGHLLAFGGTRTFHRLTAGIEDAGFEIRDSIAWLYGQGFPKSADPGCRCPSIAFTGEPEPETQHALPGVRNTDVPAAVPVGSGTGPVLLPRLPQPGTPALGTMPSEGQPWGDESGVEGWRDSAAPEGQLPALADGALPAGVRLDASLERTGATASARHGATDRPRADPRRVREPHRPRHGEQRPEQPGAVPEQPGSQARGAWPVCGRCGKPTVTGLGSALKPSFEPVVVARKPLTGTLAATVAQYGTGALNIDGSRIGTDERTYGPSAAPGGNAVRLTGGDGRDAANARAYAEASKLRDPVTVSGRWPANVVLDASQAAALDTQSGDRRSAGDYPSGASTAGLFGQRQQGQLYADAGGASRFFYTAKASTDERPSVDGIAHPTVKPVDLMRWLVKLVCPPGGTVLEPFAGSGTTVEACVLGGFRCIAIEREADYLPLILKRIRKPHAVGLDFGEWEA